MWSAIWGFIATMAFLTMIVGVITYLVYLFKHNKPKRSLFRNISLCSLVVFIATIMLAGMAARNEAGGDATHANHAQIVKERKEKQAKKASAKKKAKAKKAKEEKNLKKLSAVLATFHEQAHGIKSAKVADGGIDIRITLDDMLLDQSDAALRKVCRDAWQAGMNAAAQNGPYPDGKIDADNPLVYVQDSSGNELGRSTAFGNFKWEG